MGKRSRRRGEADEATATPPGDGAVADGVAPTAAAARDDGAAPARGGAPAGDIRLRQAMDYVEEADMLLALFRWSILAGEIPRPQAWLPRDDWPHPAAVGHAFGDCHKFLAYAARTHAPPALRTRAPDQRDSS